MGALLLEASLGEKELGQQMAGTLQSGCYLCPVMPNLWMAGMLYSGCCLGPVKPEQLVAENLQAGRFLHQVQLMLLEAEKQWSGCCLCWEMLHLLCPWQR